MRLNPPRRDVDASGGLRLAAGRELRLARALHGHHEPTSNELRIARHMAQEGKSWRDIHATLGWTCTLGTTRNRLTKFNIFPRAGYNANGRVAKFGGDTTLGNRSGIDFRPFRAGVLV